MKDSPFRWQIIFDYIFGIDEEKRIGFEKKFMIFIIIVSLISIVVVWGRII